VTAVAGLLAAGPAAPARAQLGGSIAVDSDYRLRGYSYSEGRPAATLLAAYDDPSGVYLNLSATAMLSGGGPFFLGTQANIGYSRRVDPGLSVDAGLLRADYRSPERDEPGRNYTEAYVGFTGRRIGARLSYSPDYLRDGVPALYAEVNGAFEPHPDWRVGVHLGALVYPSDARPFPNSRVFNHDWRASLTRSFGAAEIHAAVSGGGPSDEYYRDRRRDRTVLTVGASLAF
jgi:uncharacterized protein (TIGR02001 family)